MAASDPWEIEQLRERELRGQSAVSTGSGEPPLELHRQTITQFGNAFHAMQNHLGNCDQCSVYMYDGDGDLCREGKEIIFRELVFADTSIKFPQNNQ